MFLQLLQKIKEAKSPQKFNFSSQRLGDEGAKILAEKLARRITAFLV